MNFTTTLSKRSFFSLTSRRIDLLRAFFAGLLIPCGFAPFHLPGLAILGIALFFAQIRHQTFKQSMLTGFTFGVSFFGLGISWVYVSIHEYGHLNALLAASITLLLIGYLSLFTTLVAALYNKLAKNRSAFFSCLLFSALWCLSEFLRANLLGGFPWLSLGFGQIDTPLKYLLPILGVNGVSFIACFAATLLALGTSNRTIQYGWVIAFILILLFPNILQHHAWSTLERTPVSVGIIQANLSMRDKWDERLFWRLLQGYEDTINQLLGKKQLIVMPESAIPLPANYISDFMETLHQQAKQAGSAILLGIPQPTDVNETAYYNTLSTLGTASGRYFKQHLVPFGEFIPQPFQRITEWLTVPDAGMKPGKSNQTPIVVHHHPIASLICYELAYPELLRRQLPTAQWIISISDDGWFGHSLAMYQKLQMAQVMSMQTGRFQIVANNDGLSSVIDSHGNIIASLPAFSPGTLEAAIFPAHGTCPWIQWGDLPTVLLMAIILLFAIGLVVKFKI
jgi:apolipoprotein N-acyltransferase